MVFIAKHPYLFYLLNVTSRNNTTHSTPGSNNIPLLDTTHNFFQKKFLSAIKEWNRLDIKFGNQVALVYSKTYPKLHKTITK